MGRDRVIRKTPRSQRSQWSAEPHRRARSSTIVSWVLLVLVITAVLALVTSVH